MKHIRSAYTLMEILAVIAALVVLMTLATKPMKMLIADIPRANRDFQTWIQTQDMLRQLKNDVEQSTQIKIIDIDPRISSKLLYLQQSEKLVSYSLSDSQVLRQIDTSENSWDLPHVKINWQVWENDNMPYAVEITTWTERIVLNKTRKKFEQSSVYFSKTGSLKP
ncbi:MAG: hypothetical protein ISS71_00750 [Phycisphaerae bacterium]|nr:hypothetical protein [Phycisphaerae bacterium]